MRRFALVFVAVLAILCAARVALGLAPAVAADTGGYPYATMPCEHSPYAETGVCPGDDWGPVRDGSEASTFDPETGYGYRNCTDYVAWRLIQLGVPAQKVRGLHNGGQWAEYAPDNGLGVSTTPRVGDAAVAVGNPGHVAFVAAVSGSQITVDEYNQHETGAYSTQTGTPASLGFTRFVGFGLQSTGSGGSRPSEPLSAPKAVVAGAATCALLAGGQIDCWGDNEYGELGDGTDRGPDNCVPFGPCSTRPVVVTGIHNATQIVSGGNHTCALLAGGQIDCWGWNRDGALGDGADSGSSCGGVCSDVPVAVTGIHSATQIAAGADHTCALLAGGRIDCWGENDFGALGDGTDNGSSCGGVCSDVPVAVTGIQNATQIVAGGYNTCALLASGQLDCWGYNVYGQLGDGTNSGPDTCTSKEGHASVHFACSVTPVAVEGVHHATQIADGGDDICALLAGGQIDCWGDNQFGGLGDGTDRGPDHCGLYSLACSVTPVAVEGIDHATQISGECALVAGGRIDCWGYNGGGELGDGTFSGPDTCTSKEGHAPCSVVPVAVKGIQDATQISSGCALRTGGKIDCWGGNGSGQLGDGNDSDSDVPVAVSGFS